jgi:hypothetical protein
LLKEKSEVAARVVVEVAAAVTVETATGAEERTTVRVT